MEQSRLVNLGNGVGGLYIENNRFNTTLISFNFYLPLKAQTAAQNALLPYILTTCSEEYPEFSKLNFKLCSLYGASLSASVAKTGDCQRLRMSISCINDRFCFDGDSLIKESAELLASLIFAPSLDGKAFRKEDVEREKRLMKERIAGEINDKRVYAHGRLIETMFENDDYGCQRYGTLSQVDAVTPESLFEAWQNLLTTACIRVVVSSEEYPKKVFDSVAAAFGAITRENITDITVVKPFVSSGVKYAKDRMAVKQGKLVMGFSSAVNGDAKHAMHSKVMCDLFGGGPYSKLFTVVREKMSLCYYCSAQSNRKKGYLLVDSGVEAENVAKAQASIIAQLDAIKNGDFSDDDLIFSKTGICDTLKSVYDSQGGLDAWYANMAVEAEILSPEEVISLVEAVTKQDVINAAKGVSLAAVYTLMPEEEVNVYD